MKNWKIVTITAVAFVTAAMLVSTVSAMGPWGNFGGMMGGRGGMMGGGYGYGYGYSYPTQPGTDIPATPNSQYYQPVYPFQFGGGCHGGFGRNLYGSSTGPYTYTGTTLNITTAKTIAQNYLASTGNADLTIKEVEEFSANYYVQVNEKSTGNGAFELLINKYTGSIYPEMGPNMMWNTKYGMMRGGILGGIFGTPTTAMTLTQAQAATNAQQYLTSNLPGTTTGDVTAFYGYYTIEVLSNGNPYGMLSVNGYTGQVWYHTWHGTFIQELD
jgi:hypothetical protein